MEGEDDRLLIIHMVVHPFRFETWGVGLDWIGLGMKRGARNGAKRKVNRVVVGGGILSDGRGKKYSNDGAGESPE